MGNDMLKRMREFLDSEEGQRSISEWAKDYARKQDHKARWVEKFKDRCESDLDGVLEKLFNKYNSDEYVAREHKIGCEPREPLLWLAYEYASTHCQPCEDEKYFNDFTADAYYIGSYVIQLMIGQGSALRVDKIK